MATGGRQTRHVVDRRIDDLIGLLRLRLPIDLDPPHDFSIITPGRFVCLSNLRIDRILAGLSPPRLALFNESRLGGSTNINV